MRGQTPCTQECECMRKCKDHNIYIDEFGHIKRMYLNEVIDIRSFFFDEKSVFGSTKASFPGVRVTENQRTRTRSSATSSVCFMKIE